MPAAKKFVFTRREITSLLFTVLIAFAPSGTRYILKSGQILGHAVEPGTVSVFGMQLVAIAFVALVFSAYGWKGLADAARRPAAMFAASLAVFVLLSSLQAQDALAGLTSASFAVTGIATYFAIVMFRPDPREVLTGFVGGAVFQVGLGAYQFFTQSAFASKWLGMAMHSADQLGAFVIETDTGRWLRAYGSLSHPNIFGLYVGVGLLMCVGLAAYRGHGRHTRFYALMPLIAAGLLFSFSRSAILAVAAGFVWMVVSAYGSPAAPDYRRVLVPSFIIISVAAAALSLFYPDLLLTRATATGRLETQSITQRGSQFEDAMSLFANHPFTGVGIGQMPLALARESATERNWWLYDYVHDVPVLVAVETGFVGLLVWLGFVVTTLLVVRDRLLHKTSVSSGVTVYAAAFIAMLVASLFDHFLWSSWFGQLLFWTVAGLLQAAYLNLQKTR